MEIGLIVAGAATGLLVGLTGVGGGALMTPLLLLLGVAAPVAVATDLWFAALTKLAAITTYRRQTKVDWVVVRRLWLGSIPVALGVAWLASAEMGLGKVAWLSQAVGGVVCLAALGLWFGPALMRRLASAPQRA
ncbi:MAG: TSUP family transporter, partial [Thiomonas sp.]